MHRSLIACLLILAVPAFFTANADTESARAAMEDPGNPLVLIVTTRGDIYLELFPAEAPLNVENFLALAEGEIEISDPDSGATFQPNYYDASRFHRVIPGFVVQAGSPSHNTWGAPPRQLNDEINANSLGLDRLPALNPDRSFNALLNIESHADFKEELLKPLFEQMNINSAVELLDRQFEVLERLENMSVKDVYETQGYRYRTGAPSRALTRGVVALANSGPDSNGPEFFINLNDAPTLNGRYTVIGQVVEGMAVVQTIATTAVDPLQTLASSVVIYSIRRLN